MKTVKALAGDLFRSNRIGLIISFMLIPVLWGAINIVLPWLSVDLTITTGHLVIPLLLVTLFFTTTFSYSDFDKKELQTGFPKHFLLLPVRTIQLVLVPMLTSAIVIAVYYLSYYFIIIQSLSGDLPIVWFLIGAIGIVWWIQAIGWAFGHKLILGIVFMLAAVCVIAGSVVILSVGYSADIHPRQSIVSSILVVTVLSGLVLAFHAIDKLRRSEVFLPGKLNFSIALPGYHLNGPLSSGTKAQFWYEWRSFGYMAPGMILFLIAVVALTYFVDTPPPFERFIGMLGMVTSFCFVAVCFSGIEMAKPNFGAKDLQLSSYILTNPLSNKDFALTKLKVALVSMSLGWLLMAISMTVLVTWSVYHEQFMLLWQLLKNTLPHLGGGALLFVILIGSFLIAWIMMSNALSFALIGSKKLLQTIYALLGLTMVTLLLSLVYIKGHPETLEWLVPLTPDILHYLNGVALILIISLIAWLRQSKKLQGLDFKRFIVQVFLSCILLFTLYFFITKAEVTSSLILQLCNISILTWLSTITAPIAFSRRRGQ